MASTPARPLRERSRENREDVNVRLVNDTAAPRVKTRAERFAEAHARVLENHAKTFEKLAK